MTCRECEVLLGDDAFGAAVEEHLGSCLDCRASAEELRENAAALSAMRDEMLSMAPVSARSVTFSRRPRPAIWIGAAAAAVLLLALASLWPRKSAPVVSPPPPVQIAAAVPELPVLAAAAPVVTRPRKARHKQLKPEPAPEETMLVKMLTPDPEVVVYWIVGPKERTE